MYRKALAGASGGDVSEVATSNPRTTSTIAPTAIPENTNHSSLQIATQKLNGKNFLKWSRSVLMVIRGKGRLGYLDGSIPTPKPEDPSYANWEAQNSMVMAWLIHSMEDNIADTYILFPTAKKIWDAVTMAYSDLENTSQMFELRNMIRNLRQGESDVTEYYHESTKLWQELDLFTSPSWKDSEDAVLYRKLVERDRVYDFLAGLNKDLDEVRGRLLGIRPLPQIEEIFAEVRREESRRRVMLGTNTPSMENSALVVRGQESQGEERKNKKWCDHCKKPYHTKENCWKLHGKPANWTPSRARGREGKGFQVSSEKQEETEPAPTTTAFTKEQMEQLRQMLAQASSTSLMAQRGKALTVFCGLAEIGEPWIIDSGATDHMTGCAKLYTSYVPSPGNHRVQIADGTSSVVAGTGAVKIGTNVVLRGVLHVPNLNFNLLSISKLTKDLDCKVTFFPSTCVFQDQSSGKKIGSAKELNGLYYFEDDSSVHGQAQMVTSNSLSRIQKIMLLHYRLGHPSFPYMKFLFPSLFENNDKFQCEICQLAKHTRVPFPPLPYRASKPFVLIHSDIWGPSRISSITNKKWFITFTDDHTRVCWVYLLKEKSETENIFKQFHSMVKTQFNGNIKFLRTDNGTEFFKNTLGEFVTSSGIIHQSSCVNTPQQNGVSERKNRHILEVARSLLFTANLPKHFWGDAVLTATYLINRVPSRVLKFQTPIDCLYKSYPQSRFPSSLELKVFGCVAFVHNLDPHRDKLDPRAHKCIFLGYSATQKGYRCYSIEKRKYFVSRDVTFFEKQPFFTKNFLQGERMWEDNFWERSKPASTSTSNDINAWEFFWDFAPSFETQNHEHTSSNPPEKIQKIGNHEENPANIPESTQPDFAQSILPNQTPDQSLDDPKRPIPTVQEHNKTRESGLQFFDRTYVRKKNLKAVESQEVPHHQESEPMTGLETETSDLEIPIALRKGVRSCTKHPMACYVGYDHLSSSMRAFVANLANEEIPRDIQEAMKKSEWRHAVLEEMEALKRNNTWDVVKKPKEKVPVGCKWVFTVKYKADGSIERYKARLVAKGYTQTYGIDYQETFAPVAKINTVRVLLSIAANLDWSLQQLDVKNAFLNGDLEEEVYMKMPLGFEGENDQVCKLKKSLYGLKQSPRAWFDRFTKVVKEQGYKQAGGDHTLFYQHKNDKVTILLVYVDDIILTGDNLEEGERLKKKLAEQFEIKDLGSLRYFLGMEVARNRVGISVSQRKYVLDLLKETGMMGCKPAETPVEPSCKKGVEDSNPVDKGRFQRLVGRLIYLSHTRPDIAFAVSRVSQYMHAPTEEHLEAVFRILRYLKGTPGRGLFFKKGEERSVEVYTDADWAGAVEDRRSTSGYCTLVWGNLVTWRSKKQSVVARSSAEAELRSVAHGICEVLWLRMLLEELKVEVMLPLHVYCDNKAAINISHNPVHHDRTKHVEVDRHFIKEKIEEGTVCMSYVPTAEQAADILTKGLSRPLFEKLIDKLGMYNLYCPT